MMYERRLQRLEAMAWRPTVLPLADGVAFARVAGLGNPDPWQARLLRSDAQQIIMVTTRQAGKSTVASVIALRVALATPGALVLIIAPALRQSMELYRKVKAAYLALGAQAPLLRRETTVEMEFAHGGRVVCLPGANPDTIRGYSAATLVIVDEAAYVPDATYHAIRPTLATSGGRIMLLSTPWAQMGFFYETWIDGGTSWDRVEVPATAIPRIDPAFLDLERKALGIFYAQQYECRFLAQSSLLFTYDVVAAAMSDDVKPFIFEGIA